MHRLTNLLLVLCSHAAHSPLDHRFLRGSRVSSRRRQVPDKLVILRLRFLSSAAVLGAHCNPLGAPTATEGEVAVWLARLRLSHYFSHERTGRPRACSLLRSALSRGHRYPSIRRSRSPTQLPRSARHKGSILYVKGFCLRSPACGFAGYK
jgi:hypothetical protein